MVRFNDPGVDMVTISPLFGDHAILGSRLSVPV